MQVHKNIIDILLTEDKKVIKKEYRLWRKRLPELMGGGRWWFCPGCRQVWV